MSSITSVTAPAGGAPIVSRSLTEAPPSTMLFERSTFAKEVLEEILGYCTPVGKKGMQFPEQFKVLISKTSIKFQTTENVHLLSVRQGRDHGFEYLHAYVHSLYIICQLRSSIMAAQIVLAQA